MALDIGITKNKMASIDGMHLKDTQHSDTSGVLLGEDWETKDPLSQELETSRAKRSLFAFRRSPLTRKIVTFNLIALFVMIAGILSLNSSRESLIHQRARSMLIEADMAANALSARLPAQVETLTASAELMSAINGLSLRNGTTLYVFDPEGKKIAEMVSTGHLLFSGNLQESRPFTPITNGLNYLWSGLHKLIPNNDTQPTPQLSREERLQAILDPSLAGKTHFTNFRDTLAANEFAASAPIMQNNIVIGVAIMVSAAGEIDLLVKQERERVLQLLLIGAFVSISLSLVLASTISNPLSDLATAAELGREKNSKNVAPSRIRIPDLTARPDEIGRLSAALRGMVAALYDRIENNEQFAADVAHEIKNPLASLRSAVGTLRVAKRDDQREKLLDVIDHDVRRLDRLVSDISNASRLDSELVKEQQEQFNLINLMRNLTQYLGDDAQSKGIDFISDLPDHPIVINGLEARLAQVFVNLITNAISFCQDGDAIRVWVRMRDNRVLVVVEDTGPGIPDQALHKVFNRFYSERPESDFGNNSGLGLAISKQIVEAHDGVIWAENIRPTLADATSAPLGARFVVGLPL